jgi:hypothetical protein
MLATNTQDTTENVPAATSAQMSEVQVIFMKLPAAGSLLSAAEYTDIDAAKPRITSNTLQKYRR